MRDYTFGNLIADLRMRKGYSQFRLGRLVGVSDKAVSKWENGSAKPRLSTCIRLAEILGVSLDEMLSRAGYAGARAADGASLGERSREGKEMEETGNTGFREAISIAGLEDERLRDDPEDGRREDGSPEKRVELHLRTSMTPMDGVAMPEAFFRRAAQWGHDAMAVTDFGAVNAFPYAAKAAKKHGVKLIPGCELILLPEEDSPEEAGCRVTLLARNREGLVNLNRLVTIARTAKNRSAPCITREDLASRRAGLLAGSACEDGEAIRALEEGRDFREVTEIAAFYDYLEVQPPENEVPDGADAGGEEIRRWEARIREIVRVGGAAGIPVAAVSNARHPDPEAALFRAIIQYGEGCLDAENQPPYYVRTTREMLDCFRFLGEAQAREVVIRATRGIADQIEADIPLFPVHPDGKARFMPEMPEAEGELRACADREARRLYGDPLPEIVAGRIREETAAISAGKSWPRLAIARMAVTCSEEKGYTASARGAIAGSFVAFLCGITGVNPLPPHYRCPACGASLFPADGHGDGTGADLPARACARCGAPMTGDGFGIPYEPFFGLRGEKEPDFDLSIPEEVYGDIQRRLRERFGADHALRAAKFRNRLLGAMASPAVRYALDHGMPEDSPEIRRATERLGCTTIAEERDPTGVFIVPQSYDVNEFTPVRLPDGGTENGLLVTHCDVVPLSGVLLKMDFLPHDMPPLLRSLQEATGVRAEDVPLGDGETLSLFRSTEAMGIRARDALAETGTAGLPGFRGSYAQKLLKETGPRTVAQMIRISGSFHRPDAWAGERNLAEAVRKGTAWIAECPAAREDVFNRLTAYGVDRETAYAIMESLRLGRELTEDMRGRMRAAGIPGWYTEGGAMARHLLPKGRVVSDVLDVIRLAWYKLRHPRAFYAAWLSEHRDEWSPDDLNLGTEQLRQTILTIRQYDMECARGDLSPGVYCPESDETVLQLLLEMRLRNVGLPEGFR